MHPYYDLFPKIVTSNRKQSFQLESLFEPGVLAAGSAYGLLVMSRRDFRERLEQPVIVGKDSRIAFEFSPGLMGEYIVNLSLFNILIPFHISSYVAHLAKVTQNCR